jgi:aryl-alcohol dehydrogenase-like predicted oxidoreductase
MAAALSVARTAGKGVYIIKLLAHGKLATSAGDIDAALRFAFSAGAADAYNIGMSNLDQARANLQLLQEVLSEEERP